MRITGVETRPLAVRLSRPYTIAFKHLTEIEMMAVRVTDERGRVGLGSATPEPAVTGEEFDACRAALEPDRLRFLVGADARTLQALCRRLAAELPATPAARAAVDMALHDLWAQHLELPLADALGRAHRALPTSITIGIKDTAEALAEAEEYRARGFRILKIKLGHDLDADLERLRALRAAMGPAIGIRADANQGYDLAALRRFLPATRDLGIEFLEQPLPARPEEVSSELLGLAEEERRALAADESLLTERDALRLARPPLAYGIYNIKLMKCGGVRPALRIAAIAETAGIDLMWGCMDESVVGIAAALHAAFACPNTRHLDLDGSFDLAEDFARSGFELADGMLRTTGAPGLGVVARD
jgi:L-alanine-DL-glutamate epimerase-like enolase superfamily enzyme